MTFCFTSPTEFKGSVLQDFYETSFNSVPNFRDGSFLKIRSDTAHTRKKG
jgi:hypothetical protein